MKIAVLLTCFNRRQKTVSCLASLGTAYKNYNENNKEGRQLKIEIYLTDDGSSDGTADAAWSIVDYAPLHILQGSGSLYWAGGMRFCWKEAMKRNNEWDFYLLLNDDTDLLSCAFSELLSTHVYSLNQTGKAGIYSGITCSKSNPKQLTYGGDVWVNHFLGTMRRLDKTDVPQRCDMTNANILLVPKEVVNRIGIFYEKYQHDNADSDYSNYANKKGVPVWVTAGYCGVCDYDHPNRAKQAEIVCAMSLKERKEYFKNPVHSSKDYIIYRSRVTPFRLPLVLLGRLLNLYWPKLYYKIDKVR